MLKIVLLKCDKGQQENSKSGYKKGVLLLQSIEMAKTGARIF